MRDLASRARPGCASGFVDTAKRLVQGANLLEQNARCGEGYARSRPAGLTTNPEIRVDNGRSRPGAAALASFRTSVPVQGHVFCSARRWTRQATVVPLNARELTPQFQVRTRSPRSW